MRVGGNPIIGYVAKELPWMFFQFTRNPCRRCHRSEEVVVIGYWSVKEKRSNRKRCLFKYRGIDRTEKN